MAESGAKLELVGPAEEYEVPTAIPLPRDSTIILGRSSKICSVVLDATPTKSISRRHAEIVCAKQKRGPDKYILRDLGSTNGVFVNDFKVKEHTLGHGDVVQFGGAADIPVGTRFGGTGSHIRYRFSHELAARSAHPPRKRRLSAEPSADVPPVQRPKIERASTLDAAGTLRAVGNASAKRPKGGADGAKAGAAAGAGAARVGGARGASGGGEAEAVVRGGGRGATSAAMEVLRDATCGLCMQLLLDAGVLPCSHSFCRLCWDDHVRSRGTTCPMCLRKMHSSERNPRRCSNLDLLITSIVHKLASPEEREKWRVRQEYAQEQKTAAAAAAAAKRQAGKSSGGGGSGSGPIAEAREVGAAPAATTAASSSTRPVVRTDFRAAPGVNLAQNGVRSRGGPHGDRTTREVAGRRDTAVPPRKSGGGGGGGGGRGRGVAAVSAAAEEGDGEGQEEVVTCEGCNEEGHEFRRCPHRSDSALEGSESDGDESESESEEEEDGSDDA